jgi:hypothetical protein
MNTKHLISLALLSVAGTASAQVAISGIAGTSNGVLGNVSNTTQTGLATTSAAFVVGNTVNIDSFQVDGITGGLFGTSARVILFNSAFPNAWGLVTVTQTGITSTSSFPVSSTIATASLTGPLVGQVVPSGSTWDVSVGHASTTTGSITVSNGSITVNSGSLLALPTVFESITIPTMSAFGALGAVENNTATVASTATAGYVIGTSAVMLSGGITTNPSIDSYSSEARMKIVHSALPSVTGAVTPISITAYYLPIGFANGTTASVAGTITGAVIPTGGSWALEAYESVNDEVANVTSESTWTGVSIGLSGASLPIPVFNASVTNLPIFGLVRDAGNTTANLGTVTSAFTFGSRIVVNSGSMTRVTAVTTSLPSDARIRVRNSAFPGFFCDWQPSAVAAYTSSTASVPSIVRQLPVYNAGGAVVNNFVGLNIPAGSTFSGEAFATTDREVGAVDAQFDSLSFSFTSHTASTYTGATFSAAFVDLGNINATTAPLATPLSAPWLVDTAGVVRWFKFNLESTLTSTNFLDIYVDLPTGAATDTTIAVFRTDGTLVALDDDDDTGLASALTFGTTASPRPANGTGLVFNGRDGEVVPAGSYYLAAWRYNAGWSVNNGFAITAPSTLTHTVANNIYLRTDLAAPSGTVVSGTVDLGGLGDPMTIATEVLTLKVLDSGGNVVSTVTTSINSSGAYSVNVPVSSGTYTLQATTPTSLRKNYTNISFGSPVTQNITLINGNCDLNEDNNEIGPGDLQIVLDNFGQDPFDPRSDVDNDLECGPGDLQIVLDNFGTEGD